MTSATPNAPGSDELADDLVHRCLAGRGCRGKEPGPTNTTTGHVMLLPAATDRPDTLCRRCELRVRNAVEDLPDIFDSLHDALGEIELGSTGVKVKSSPEPPAPINMRIDELSDRIAEYLVRAAMRVAPTLGVDPPATSRLRGSADRQKPVIQRCADIVEPHVGRLLRSPQRLETTWRHGESVELVYRSGVTIALELIKAWEDANSRGFLGAYDTEPSPRLPYGCPDCGYPNLFMVRGKEVCPDCTERAQLDKARKETEDMELREQLDAVTEQRDTAWGRLDAVARFVGGIETVLPPGTALNADQIHGILGPYVEGHPTPEERTESEDQ